MYRWREFRFSSAYVITISKWYRGLSPSFAACLRRPSRIDFFDFFFDSIFKWYFSLDFWWDFSLLAPISSSRLPDWLIDRFRFRHIASITGEIADFRFRFPLLRLIFDFVGYDLHVGPAFDFLRRLSILLWFSPLISTFRHAPCWLRFSFQNIFFIIAALIISLHYFLDIITIISLPACAFFAGRCRLRWLLFADFRLMLSWCHWLFSLMSELIIDISSFLSFSHCAISMSRIVMTLPFRCVLRQLIITKYFISAVAGWFHYKHCRLLITPASFHEIIKIFFIDDIFISFAVAAPVIFRL